MAGFEMDYSEIQDFNVENGTYEVVINGVKEDATKSGAQYVNFDLIIRNDIADQKFKNAHIFHKVWVSKETGKYNMSMLMTVAKYAGIPDHTTFNSIDEYFNALYHKPVLVTVRNEKSTYNDKEYENLNIKRWALSSFPNVQHQFKADDSQQQSVGDPFAQNGQPVEISDDDLPF
ncbi:MAG: DUF669 domain-containing protein [Liquorilactobacillus hordei]|uniref:Single stranded binding protein n=1 Tax=Liquorilactobacillus mali KCTC 3596 = DSM 20444 TaxID=1046596 RepID=J0L8D1_9LACO|nr:DUF669 domain-containing protein [Liquorilactobacillus mali]EJF02142.1 hypothetical protein LMA_00120 [Liquorilactobacillus mali KCTC 3596 = DSM 20444]KRN06379.1 hypothetical protein FD00_GL000235 [Liquorilactobacillus mali KCTC 3596 = DSM 20444]MDN7145296.1 DUF669 domain-containing protein [Liquorilactobacillus mali]QFQ74551.1 DUF669 domain-containing protein [Liquorilactobacillus mali]